MEAVCFNLNAVEDHAKNPEVTSILAFTSDAPSIGLCDDLWRNHSMAMEKCSPQINAGLKHATRWVREVA